MDIVYRGYYTNDGAFDKYRVNSACVLIIKGEFQGLKGNNEASLSQFCYILTTNNSGNGEGNIGYNYNVFNSVTFETMYNTGSENRVYYSLIGEGEYKELYLYFRRGRGKYTITTLNTTKDCLYNTNETISYNDFIAEINTIYKGPDSNDIKIPKIDFSTASKNRNIRTRFINNSTKEISPQRKIIELEAQSGIYSINPSGGSIIRITLNRYNNPLSILLSKDKNNSNYFRIYDVVGDIYDYKKYIAIENDKLYINVQITAETIAIIEVIISYGDLKLTKEDIFPSASKSIDWYMQNSGTLADKPSNQFIGFSYFCTDKKSPEGDTDGIMIYYKGNNVWVDGLGRVVDDNYPILNNGTTEQRPTSISAGFQYFDTTLKKPIWWTGTEWVDSTGVIV